MGKIQGTKNNLFILYQLYVCCIVRFCLYNILYVPVGRAENVVFKFVNGYIL